MAEIKNINDLSMSQNDLTAVINTLQKSLLKQKNSEAGLNDEGEHLLNAIENGAWGDGLLSTTLNGILLNYSPEIISKGRDVVSNIKGAITGNERSDDVGIVGKYLESALPETGYTGDLPTGYDIGKVLQQKEIDQTWQDKPVRSFATEMGGSLIPSILTPNKLAITHPMKTAMGSAGIYGSGTGGDDATSLTESVIDRTLTGGIYAPTGIVGHAIGKGTINVGKSLYNIARNPTEAGLKQARKIIKEKIVADGLNFDEAVKWVLKESGKLVSFADVGENTRQLLNAVNMWGHGASTAKINEFLRNRNSGRLARLKDDLYDALGNKGKFFNEFAALRKARSKNAAPLYEKAFKFDIPVDNTLISLIQRLPSGVVNRAKKLAQIDGSNIGDITLRNGKLINKKGQPVKFINTRFLHYVQEGLRDMGGSASRQGSGTAAHKIGTLHKDLWGHLLKNNKTYKAAADRYAGDSAMMRAMELGNRLFKENVDELSELLRNMNPSELEAFRTGALNHLIGILENSVTTGNLPNKLLRTENQKQLLRMTFPSTQAGKRQFEKFWKNLQTELNTFTTESFVRFGSKTAGSQQILKQMDQAAARSFAGTDSLFGSIKKILQQSMADVAEEQKNSTAYEITRVLTAQGEKTIRKIQNELNEGGGVLQATAKHAPNVLDKIKSLIESPQVLGQFGGRLGEPVGNLASGLLNTNLAQGIYGLLSSPATEDNQ